MEKKFAMSEKVKKELEEHMETLRKVLEDKENEVKDAKDQLRQAKEAAIREYRDSNALLQELRTSYADGFDDAICQAKKAYPDLDFSHLNIDTQAQATAQPVAFVSTDDLFADDAALGDEESAPVENQAQPVDDDAHQPVIVQENVENTPPISKIFLFFWNCNYLGNSLLTYPSSVACKNIPFKGFK